MIEVGLGVVLRSRGMSAFCLGSVETLLTRRPAGAVYGGWWEFPGGKLEGGETPEACVIRELEEELGVLIEVARALTGPIVHRYEHGIVRLHPWVCRLREGSPEPRNLGVAAHQWTPVGELGTVGLLPANGPIVAALVAGWGGQS